MLPQLCKLIDKVDIHNQIVVKLYFVSWFIKALLAGEDVRICIYEHTTFFLQ